MDVLARPMLIAQASAPILVALLLDRIGVQAVLAACSSLVFLGLIGLCKLKAPV